MLCLSTHGRFVPEADLQNTVQIDAWITPLGSDGPWLGLFPHAREIRICALSSSRSPQRLPVLKPEWTACYSNPVEMRKGYARQVRTVSQDGQLSLFQVERPPLPASHQATPVYSSSAWD